MALGNKLALVEDSQVIQFTPNDQVFCIDELFDEWALISFESAEEQAKSEAAFWFKIPTVTVSIVSDRV